MTDALPGKSDPPLPGRWLERLPGGRFAKDQIDKAEKRLLTELKDRLDQVTPPPAVSVVAVAVSRQQRKAPDDPATLLRALLKASEEGTKESGSTTFFCAVLRSMVPDEARLLAALSDGSRYPVVRLFAGPRLGPAAECVLDHVSSIGKSAGVSWNDLTPVYLARLTQWGLIELQLEDEQQTMRYQILETEDLLRRRQALARSAGLRTVIHRQTLVLSPLGQALWSACQVEARTP
jgi:hypothetical protein